MAPRRSSMTQEHKNALAEGRNQSRAISSYLEALDTNRPKRGRKRTKDSIEKRLARIDREIDAASAVKRLQLFQERIDLQKEQAHADQKADLSDLEKGFVAAAAAYSERKGISYAAWRELGIEPTLLAKAGIKRTRG